MGNFSNMAITDSGRVLYADVQAGAVLVPTRITIGSGSVPAGKTAAAMTDVVNAIKDLTINKRKRSNDGKATFGGVYSNTDITQAFYFRELALYCKAEYRDNSGAVTQESGEVLFAYGNAGDTADYMPAYSTNTVVEKQIDIVVWVGNDAQVDLTIESGIYMTQEQLDNALSDIRTNISDVSLDMTSHVNNTTGNPHKVDPAMIGAVPTSRKVNNKALSSDITLGASDVGAVPTTRKVNGKELSDDITLGASDVGAAASSHTHNYAGSSSAGGAADSAVKFSTARKVTVDLASETGADFDGSKAITPGVSGILPVTHGGTGAATAEEARERLGVITLDEIPNLYIWKKYDVEPGAVETEKSNVWISKPTQTADGGYVNYSVQYADAITNEDGILSLVNPTTLDDPDKDTIQVVKGKYIYSVYLSAYFRIPSDASIVENKVTYPTTYYTLQVSTAYGLTPSGNKLGYASSKKADTYPENGEHADGYWYVYHKQLGE